MSMFGTSIHNPPDGLLPRLLEDLVLPRPREISRGGGFLTLSRAGRSEADLLFDDGATGGERAAVAWLTRELRRAHGWVPAPRGAAAHHVVVGVSGPGTETGRWVDRLAMRVPPQPESYALRCGADHLVLAARTAEDLLRGVTTLVHLLSVDGTGSLGAAHVDIIDWPALPLRILIGWVREDPGAREMIDLAFKWKYNRVFFGVWNWTAGERLRDSDRSLVAYARERGVELMFQLSRLSFTDGFDADTPADAARVISAYQTAVEAGFRSFGILFDDQTLQGVDAEIRLTLAIHERLRDLDLWLLRDYYETRQALDGVVDAAEPRASLLDAYRARQDARRQALLTLQSRRSPPSAELRAVLVQPDGTDRVAERKPPEIPSGWWLTYFYVPMRDDIDAILRLAEELLGEKTPA